MTDHDLIIQLDTKMNTLLEKVDSIDTHATVMNAEQGIQASRITGLETKMAVVQWLTVTMVGALLVALIGASVRNLLKKELK